MVAVRDQRKPGDSWPSIPALDMFVMPVLAIGVFVAIWGTIGVLVDRLNGQPIWRDLVIGLPMLILGTTLAVIRAVLRRRRF